MTDSIFDLPGKHRSIHRQLSAIGTLDALDEACMCKVGEKTVETESDFHLEINSNTFTPTNIISTTAAAPMRDPTRDSLTSLFYLVSLKGRASFPLFCAIVVSYHPVVTWDTATTARCVRPQRVESSSGTELDSQAKSSSDQE